MITLSIPPVIRDSSPAWVAVFVLFLLPPLILTLPLLPLTIYNLHFHPLASYPGPLSHRASTLPYITHTLLGTTVQHHARLHARYGPVVRIAPNQLSYISVAAWRDIYAVREGREGSPGRGCLGVKGYQGAKGKRGDNTVCAKEMIKEELVFPGDDFEFFAPAKPMISCDAANHGRHRRAVASAFSERAVRSYEGVILEKTALLMRRLDDEQGRVDLSGSRRGGSGGINIMDWFHFVMFDITSALVFGKSFGNLERGGYHEWVARVFPGMKLVAWSLAVAEVPGLGRLISWFLPRKMVSEARRHVQSIIDMTDARNRAQLTNPPHQVDFMSYILPPLEGEKGTTAYLSEEELYLNAQLLCIAGSETTASLLAGAVYFLSLRENARHRDRLITELRGQFASVEDITPTNLALRAPFLGAVLNECLRLYPPGAINMPRTVPAGGAMIDGNYVAGGSVVGIAQFAAYRSATHWIDPLTFAPERWLEGSQGRYAGDRKDVFKPFSFGPRNCVGQSLAVAECRLIVARLFWEFDVHVLAGQEDWVRQKTFLSWEKPPLMVNVRRRLSVDPCEPV
ncbi:cytochrome P450 [Podospora aff. communis PSN243]|uniref:Cytochrome P450 n=1 Tax=Podospora aff. communis PSN243 TaxID=3040156 RepID=A0AAV9G584_9PEZI|nr:cytochrome P450 [Podospora aff. communis PSN243]